MLVLSRKVGERIFFYLADGGRIELTVHKIKAKNAIIAIDAPSEVRVIRGELAKIDENSKN